MCVRSLRVLYIEYLSWSLISVMCSKIRYREVLLFPVTSTIGLASLQWLTLVHLSGRIARITPERWMPAIEGIEDFAVSDMHDLRVTQINSCICTIDNNQLCRWVPFAYTTVR